MPIGLAQFIVIDTLLTSMGDGDIKDTSDSYSAIREVGKIAKQTRATVLLVHHTPDNGTGPMGGSAWRGGLPVRIYLTRQRGTEKLGESSDFRDGDTVTLTCKKLTKAAHFEPITIPVKIVRVKGAVWIPVLATEKSKRQQRTTNANTATSDPKSAKPRMDFQAALAAFGEDRAKLAKVTGLSSAAIRQRLSRLKRAESDAA